jgi:hypothetical protein
MIKIEGSGPIRQRQGSADPDPHHSVIGPDHWCAGSVLKYQRTVPEIIDTVFAKTSPKRLFSMTEYERFGLVLTKTRVYKFGHRSGGSPLANTVRIP